ncbi:MAG: hypothetical protein QM613_06165 [Micrococcaceae bacterium]
MFRTNVRIDEIDLNRELAPNKHTTFFFRATGEVESAEVANGDELVVDKAVAPKNGDPVIAHDDEEFFIMRYPLPNGYYFWGTIVYRIHAMR